MASERYKSLLSPVPVSEAVSHLRRGCSPPVSCRVRCSGRVPVNRSTRVPSVTGRPRVVFHPCHFSSVHFKSAIWRNEEWHVLRLESEKLETAVDAQHFQNAQIFQRNMPVMCNSVLVFAEMCTFRTLRLWCVLAHRLFAAEDDAASPGNKSFIIKGPTGVLFYLW